MAKRQNVDMSANNDVVKIVASEEGSEVTQTDAAQPAAAPKKVRQGRSQRYQAARSKVDRTKFYDPSTAVELVKELSYSKFPGTVSVDVLTKDIMSVDLTLPHATGKSIRVAIVDDAVLEALQAGKIEFDVLVTARQFVPKLAKFAKVLGPRGLMPNPKNGTITENPEGKKAELESGKMTFKTEKKQPVMHITLGKTSMKTAELAENLEAVLTALTGKVVRAAVSATMSPGVKVKIS